MSKPNNPQLSEITLCDLFAAFSLAGIEANGARLYSSERIAKLAYEDANAMLAECERWKKWEKWEQK